MTIRFSEVTAIVMEGGGLFRKTCCGVCGQKLRHCIQVYPELWLNFRSVNNQHPLLVVRRIYLQLAII